MTHDVQLVATALVLPIGAAPSTCGRARRSSRGGRVASIELIDGIGFGQSDWLGVGECFGISDGLSFGESVGVGDGCWGAERCWGEGEKGEEGEC